MSTTPTPTAPFDYAAYIEAHGARFAAALAAVPTMRTTQVHNTGDVELIVTSVSYGRDADVEAVIAGTADAEMVVLTEDGRRADYNVWHEGPTDIDTWVTYERWTVEGRIAHGFIDPVSRRLVQAG